MASTTTNMTTMASSIAPVPIIDLTNDSSDSESEDHIKVIDLTYSSSESEEEEDPQPSRYTASKKTQHTAASKVCKDYMHVQRAFARLHRDPDLQKAYRPAALAERLTPYRKRAEADINYFYRDARTLKVSEDKSPKELANRIKIIILRGYRLAKFYNKA